MSVATIWVLAGNKVVQVARAIIDKSSIEEVHDMSTCDQSR